jgi:hypothetical protein
MRLFEIADVDLSLVESFVVEFKTVSCALDLTELIKEVIN